MSALTKTRHTNSKKTGSVITMRHAGVVYKIPKTVAEKYISEDDHLVSPDVVFADINKKYTKPGALLRGLRARENLSQVALAEKLHVTQSDISQMENGTRSIGRTIAKRIEALFDVDYRSFLS